jgi:hypothetical protein
VDVSVVDFAGRAHGAGTQVRWIRTPADGRRHLFRPDHIGELVAEAVCEWRVRTSTLSAAEDGVRCYACRLLRAWELDRRKCGRG